MQKNIYELEELVINWHVTEACNFKCRYCFAKWSNGKSGISELWRDDYKWQNMLKNVYHFFSPNNHKNPLRQAVKWNTVRLTIAGGEPSLLGANFQKIVRYAVKLGFKVSIITNASRPEVIIPIVNDLDILTMSIDSSEDVINERIGRLSYQGVKIPNDQFVELAQKTRAINPYIKIKINTVVNAANRSADLSKIITAIAPERWKIMRVLPLLSDELKVSTEEFHGFIQRHQRTKVRLTTEDNSEMTQSYLMIDPYGRFYQNSTSGGEYTYSESLIKDSVENAFSGVQFSVKAYLHRYSSVSMGMEPSK